MESNWPAQQAIPAVVDHYQLVRILGSGGTGIVCEAHDTLLGRRVAIKLIPNKQTAGSDQPQIMREARIASEVKHPHVVSLYDTGTYAGGVYLVMELVEGRSVQSLLDEGPLPWREATAILVAACEGLAAVHARGIIHRDIKPGNILLEKVDSRQNTVDSGNAIGASTTPKSDCSATDYRLSTTDYSSLTGGFFVKITDFSLARWLDQSKRSATWKRLAGTPHYMSPEQCREEEYDERTDIYSLGATYFAVLTGCMPYAGSTPLRVMFEHCSAPVPDPCKGDREIPIACAEIVIRAMAKKRADRYDSARDMQNALRKVLQSDARR